MSSHHIVRDAQEPALVILDQLFDNALVQDLLEWSPTVIINAALVDSIVNQGFKVDVVVGQLNEIEGAREKLQHQSPIKFLTKNINDDDILLAVYFLTAGKYKAVNIVTSFDKRLIDKLNPFIGMLDVVIYSGQCKWYFSRDDFFKKWVAKKASFFMAAEAIVLLNETSLTIDKSGDYYHFDCSEEGFLTIKNRSKGFWLGEAI